MKDAGLDCNLVCCLVSSLVLAAVVGYLALSEKNNARSMPAENEIAPFMFAKDQAIYPKEVLHACTALQEFSYLVDTLFVYLPGRVTTYCFPGLAYSN